MTATRQRYVVTYGGRVQGVGFRLTAVSQSHGLDVHGFVRNESDGTVLLDVEGSERDLTELLARIDAAMGDQIESRDVQPQQPANRSGGFRIAY